MDYKNYIARKRARFKSVSGEVNIPYGTALEVEGAFICWNGKPLCYPTSQSAHDFFSQNDDNLGLERGALVTAILACMEKPNGEQIERLEKLAADGKCARYRRPEHEDVWIWNQDFFDASPDELRYIASRIGAKVLD